MGECLSLVILHDAGHEPESSIALSGQQGEQLRAMKAKERIIGITPASDDVDGTFGIGAQ